MTTITVYRTPESKPVAFRAEGHAQARARRGEDIVCSAVSALTQTAVNAMQAIAGVDTRPRVGDGLLEAFLPAGLTQEQATTCDIILRTMLQGLTDIQTSYPAHVRVVYKEMEGTSCLL